MKHQHISFKEYTMDNLSLPTNLADLIPPDNMAHVAHEMVERNSYSKADTDATFMRLKEDHMKNGQHKPAYNVQVGLCDQFILSYSIHQRPGGTRCLLPHLEGMRASYNLDIT